MKKAELFEIIDAEKKTLRCLACSQKCIIGEGKTGLCGVRKNINGEFYLLVYGKIVSQNIDPIEKKPLNDFLKRSYSYSIGVLGCNFKCLFCQNYDISQFREFYEDNVIDKIPETSPEEVVDEALRTGCKSISYTYTEPAIFVEYIKDVAIKAREKGLKNVLVTNRYMSNEGLEFLYDKDKEESLIDAMNIDLKSFDDGFYRDICGATKGMQPVLDTIKRAVEAGIHVEITTLVIPGENDSSENLKKIAEFIYSLDNGSGKEKGNVPWHISRFFPMYKFDDGIHKPTSIDKLKEAEMIGKDAGLKKVYLGNV